MPYIKDEKRWELDGLVDMLATRIKEDPDAAAGALNYCITTLCIKATKHMGHRYSRIMTMAGVLSNVTSEIYRRYSAVIEDEKAVENGDIGWF